MKTPLAHARDRIVGTDIPDQRRLRPSRPVADLEEFLGFLDEIEELFGPIERRARVAPRAPLRL